MSLVIGFAITLATATAIAGLLVTSRYGLVAVGVLVIALGYFGTRYVSGNRILHEVCDEQSPCVADYYQIFSGEHPNAAVNSLVRLQAMNDKYGVVIWALSYGVIILCIRRARSGRGEARR